MPTDIHIVNKQVFELECRHSEHAFHIQKKIDYAVQDKIAAAIDKACHQLNAGDQNIRIPLLEIDLGMLSFENLEDDIVTVFEKKFYKKLWEKADSQMNRGAVLSPKQQSSFESVQYFFLTGRLPWFAGKRDSNYPFDIFDELLSKHEDEFTRFILLNIRNEKFIERLVWQPDIRIVEKIMNLLGISANVLIDMEEEIQKTLEAVLTLLRKRHSETSAGNSFISTEEDARKIKKEEKRIGAWLQGEKNIKAVQLRKMSFWIILKCISEKRTFSAPVPFFEFFDKLLAAKFDFDTGIINRELLKEGLPQPDLPETISKIVEKLEKNIALSGHQTLQEDVTDEELKFYISNAGLVLLAHYLPAFFKELNLLDHGSFAGKQEKIKAIFLLHHICSGEETAPEYILPLNKILCGLPLDEPLPSFISLSNEEKQECGELLNEVINNWNRLGHSSIDGLREAFLNRDGILSYNNSGWKLQVERKGYDILLDSLPWSYNYIKLSWMENLITTEW